MLRRLRHYMRPSYRKVGGLHFIKLHRVTFMVCVSKRALT